MRPWNARLDVSQGHFHGDEGMFDSPGDDAQMTDNEGSLLALVLSREPLTAYQLLRLYKQSPVIRFNESKGALYPIVRRLKARGYLEARQIPGMRRKAERLHCSHRGREAARRWIMKIEQRHILVEDPLRTRATYFGLLDRVEQHAWVAKARALTEQKLAVMSSALVQEGRDLGYAIEDNVFVALQGRLRWLENLSDTVIVQDV